MQFSRNRNIKIYINILCSRDVAASEALDHIHHCIDQCYPILTKNLGSFHNRHCFLLHKALFRKIFQSRCKHGNIFSLFLRYCYIFRRNGNFLSIHPNDDLRVDPNTNSSRTERKTDMQLKSKRLAKKRHVLSFFLYD